MRGLFGHLTHEVKLRDEERLTILTGPNASGKTHLLKILAGIVGLDFPSIARLPFQDAQVKYSNGDVLAVTRHSDGTRLKIATKHHGRCYDGEILPLSGFDDSNLPDYMEKAAPDVDVWIDIRDGEELNEEALVRRFDLKRGPSLAEILRQLPWLTGFQPAARPTLIETGRLELPNPAPRVRLGKVQRRAAAETRIATYTEQISRLIGEAQADSLAISQQVDRRFASQALDKARATVQEGELRRRYEQLSDVHQALQSNGLTEETPGVAFPAGRTNPTERRILNVYLDDWEAKLAPLMPVHEKIELWRSVVGNKLVDKSISIGSRGRIRFRSRAGDAITVDMLSSGEQHLVALYTMLLFAATPRSAVLIDEPEISLHAAWKHAFVGDIHRIASINDLHIVLATHSTAIINGRWELVEELTLLPE